jgi:L-gulonolactone oxidase
MPLWRNWAGDQRCAPVAIERPASEQEVAEAVGRAAERELSVRVAGAGHSFTDIVCTDGVLFDLSRMDRVLDQDGELVRVQAGATLHALGSQLAQRGLALENQGDIDAQALAGALQTATHGTGVRFGNLSSRVEGLRVVTGAGEAVELAGDDLRAARVGLGALGVVTEVTLRALPLYTLHRRDEKRPLGETLDRLDEHVDSNDHFEFFAFPYTDEALTRTTRRSHEQPPDRPERRLSLQEDLLENAALELICRAGRLAPAQIPRLNRLITRLASSSEKVDRSARVYASRRSVRFTEMEYAIPRAHAREAVERVIDLIERRRLAVSFPIEVRFSAPDDAYLSTASGRETAYVAVHVYRGMEFESYFRGVEAIMDEYGGRPHWGKRHYQTAATLSGRYPGWDAFRAARARLDPDGLFENDYTRRVLGPASSRTSSAAGRRSEIRSTHSPA